MAVLAIAAVLTGPAHAGAATLVDPEGHTPQPYQRWVDRSRMPTVGSTVLFTVGPCFQPTAGYGCAGNVPRPSVWLDTPAFRRDGSDWTEIREATMHEMGHLFDWQQMTSGARSRFRRLTGRTRYTWWTTETIAQPGEQFAEAYALCATHRYPPAEPVRPWHVISGYAYDVSALTHLKICAMIRRVGVRAGLTVRRPRRRGLCLLEDGRGRG